MAKQPMKDVIVLLPGILGSVLERDGKEVWAPSPGAIGRALWRLGRNLNDLALGDDPWESDDLGDGVTATRLMPDVHIIPGLWGIDGYSGISSMIRSTFDVTDGVNFFEFPYDWRRDNRAAARGLKELTDRALHARRKEVGDDDVKLILVGHSMGGLVSRYFLECLDGWRDTRALITFGTPYRGSVNAVDFLANGFVKKLGPLKLVDLTKLLHSLTSVYQLLPLYPCIDLGDGYIRPAETDDKISGLDASRAQTALQFHHDIRDATANHDSNAYAIHSIVGITQGTKQSARLDDGHLVIESTYDGEDRGGDGTVPRDSATPIETDDWGGYQPMYSSDMHGSLQNDDAVQTQLAGILTERSSDAFRGDVFDKARGIPVDVPELLSVGEPLDVVAGPVRSGLQLGADVIDLSTGRSAIESPVTLGQDSNGVHTGVVPPLPSGDYRVRIAGVGDSATSADPVHSLLCVFDDEELE